MPQLGLNINVKLLISFEYKETMLDMWEGLSVDSGRWIPPKSSLPTQSMRKKAKQQLHSLAVKGPQACQPSEPERQVLEAF